MKHHPRVRLRAGLLFLAIAAALPVAAQTRSGNGPTPDDTPQDKATTLDTISVKGQQAPTYTVDESTAATRLPLTLKDTPQSISVITAQRMQDQDLTSVRDVLDNTVGVSSNAYDTQRVVFWSRGFQIENMAYDGVPVAASLNVGSADASLDTAVYDRIEVVRGATGLLSGAGSPAAMIDFVRKHADSRTPQAEVSLDWGSYGTVRASADGSTPLNASGSVRGRLVAVHEDGDSYLDRYHDRKNVLYGVVDADLGADTTLSLGYDYQKTKPTGVTWGSYPLFYSDGGFIHWPRGFTSAADWTWWNNTTQTAFAQLRHSFANGWQVHAELSHRETYADSALFYVSGLPDRETGQGLYPYAYKSYQHGRQNMVDVYASGPFQAFGREQQLVLGFNGSNYGTNYYDYPNGELPDIGDFNAWHGVYPYPDFASRSEFVSYARIRQQGLYATLRLQLADPFKLIAGARYARWQNDTIDTTSGIYHERQSKTLPYAGLIYDITPTYSAFASYTKIFDPQTNRTVTGSYLAPMLGSSREVGIKGRHFDGALNTSLTFFETRLDNVAEAAVGQFLPDGITQAYYAGNGTRSRGYEFEVSGSFNEDWNGTFGWSHFNVKAPGEGAIRTSLPRTLVRTFTTWHLPGSWNRLTIGGGLNWRGPSHAPVINSVDGVSTTVVDQPSVLLASAMARYAFNDHASLQVNGDNLLNKRYLVLDDYSDPYYAPPAEFMVSFNYKFF